MPLNIRNPEADRLATRLAQLTRTSKTDAVIRSLEDRLDRISREKSGKSLADELMAIGRHCAALPELDSRTAEEILGYDENGLPS